MADNIDININYENQNAQQQYYQNYDQNQANHYYYEYDPYNIEYQHIQFDQWHQIPVDQSQYSQYWYDPTQFEPEQFSNNTKKEKRCNDIFWAFLFLINLIATITLFVIIYKKYKLHYTQSSLIDFHVQKIENFIKFFCFDALIAFGLNLFHFLYATFLPRFYMKLSLLLNVIIAIGISVWHFKVFHLQYLFVYPVLYAIVVFIAFICIRLFIKFSIDIMELSSTIIRKYPSIIVFIFIYSLVLMATTAFFDFLFAFIHFVDSKFWDIFVFFSFFWVTKTMGYIVYMSISGLTASWYFLKGTEYFPKYPLLGSLKRSFTTSFGSIAFAGLLLTVLNYLNSLLKYFGRACCFIPCIYCCCEYLRSCLKKMVSAITKLSLTYCAIYGVPFMEGCRRWTELSCRKFSDVLVHDGCITATITLNEIFYVMIAGLLGSFIAPRGFEIISFIWAANFTYSLFVILIKPTEAVFDTIIVCFIEEPSKLSQISNRLYERFCDQYHKRIEKFKKRNEKST